MARFNSLVAFLLTLLLAACDRGWPVPLPYPTPGKQNLVVLTRPGPLTYQLDESGSISGLEYDLVNGLAEELGVPVKFNVLSPGELSRQLLNGSYHIAASWLSPGSNPEMQSGPPLFQTHDVLAQHEASLPLTSLDQLAGKTVHALAGTRQAATIRRLMEKIPGLQLIEIGQGDVIDLLEALGEQKISYVAMDGKFADIANQYVPSLRTTLPLSSEAPVVWWLGPVPNPELKARIEAYLERIRADGTLARLEERYFGHVRRLQQDDVEKFLGHIKTTLPQLRKHFLDAERQTGIDWRLIAALAWQESHWDPFATSYTNVRGLMMLTEETADRLGVSNRLDPRESVLAGARYLNMIRNSLPHDMPEPDRTWLAIAGYNIGPGHLNAARTIGKQLNADPGAWYDMKRVLPLLAKPKYYSRLKSGRARGGEAVIMVENIRSYYDILVRNAPPLTAAISPMDGKIGMRGEAPELRLGR